MSGEVLLDHGYEVSEIVGLEFEIRSFSSMVGGVERDRQTCRLEERDV